MKAPQEYLQELKLLTTVFGFDPSITAQRTEQWQRLRLGVITASESNNLIKKGKGGKPSQSRQTYMNQLVAEVSTGIVAEDINAKPLIWGRANEDGARSAYEFVAKETIIPMPFVFKDSSLRCGISMDGFIDGKAKGLELKCPYTTAKHIEFVLQGAIKEDYVCQCQYSMWVTGAREWVFASYDPRMKNKMLHFVEMKRDEAYMEQFDIEVPKFIKEMDEMLAELGIPFGAQWQTISEAA